VRGVGELDVVVVCPVADFIAEMGAEVVEDEVQPHLGWIERTGVAAKGEELDPCLALLDVAVEAIAGEVIGAGMWRTPWGRV
jgi:hypothetical protein